MVMARVNANALRAAPGGTVTPRSVVETVKFSKTPDRIACLARTAALRLVEVATQSSPLNASCG